VLAAVSGALINELHGGWPWWLASVVVVLASAGLTAWLTADSGSAARTIRRIGTGAVVAGRNIEVGGNVSTAWSSRVAVPLADTGPGRTVDPGAVVAGENLTVGGDLATGLGGPGGPAQP